MKKITKIFLTLALCLVITLGLAMTSSAAEPDTPYSHEMNAMEIRSDRDEAHEYGVKSNEAVENEVGECGDPDESGIHSKNDDAHKYSDTDEIGKYSDADEIGKDSDTDEVGECGDGDEIGKYSDADEIGERGDADENDEHVENVDENGEKEEKNDFEEIYNAAMSHISEILSLAAFIGSLVCAIIYKSGLMPLMENGLKSLKNAALKIKEATDKAECDNKESIVNISRKIDDIENTLGDMCDAFLAVIDALEGYENHREHQKRLDTVLEGELDMLYDIFMTSALPEYEKARVGERMTKLKEALNSGEGKK